MSAALCSVCNNPMVEGQAFNGMRRSHWDCAPAASLESLPFRRLLPERSLAPESAGAQPLAGLDRPAPRLPERGPTSADVRKSAMDPKARQIESRRWTEVSRTAENGRTRIGLECPFCYAVVRAYVWSLPNGKRCDCGAYHGRILTTHWHQESPQ